MPSFAPPLTQHRPLASIHWISDDAFVAAVAAGLARVYDAVDFAHGPAAYLDLVVGQPDLLRGDFAFPSGILWPSADGSRPVLFAAHLIGRREVIDRMAILDLVVAATDLAPSTAVLVTTGLLPAESGELAERAHDQYGVDLILVDGGDLPELLQGRLNPSA